METCYTAVFWKLVQLACWFSSPSCWISIYSHFTFDQGNVRTFLVNKIHYKKPNYISCILIPLQSHITFEYGFVLLTLHKLKQILTLTPPHYIKKWWNEFKEIWRSSWNQQPSFSSTKRVVQIHQRGSVGTCRAITLWNTSSLMLISTSNLANFFSASVLADRRSLQGDTNWGKSRTWREAGGE